MERSAFPPTPSTRSTSARRSESPSNGAADAWLWNTHVVPLEKLDQMVGSSLLVRVNYLGPDGAVEHVAEFAGVVSAVDPLVTIDRGGDHPFTLPPEPDAYHVGERGHYRLHSTGETVIDPAFTTVWTVHPPSVDERR